MKWLSLRTVRSAGWALGLGIVTTFGLGLVAPAQAASTKEAVMASFDPLTGVLTVRGDEQNNAITIGRDPAGTIQVNGGAVQIAGGPVLVANTAQIDVFGFGKNDQLTLDETGGPLPGARMWGGEGNDTLTGGSGGDQLLGEAGNDMLLGMAGGDVLAGGDGNDTLTGGSGGDQLLGEAGNDSIAWARGDESDLIEGGDGNDDIKVSGGDDAEIFTMTVDNNRTRFERVDPSPLILDIGTTEALALTTNGGDDQVAVGLGVDQVMKISVDGLAMASGDALVEGEQNTLQGGSAGITASFSPSSGTLTIFGNNRDNAISTNRNAAGTLLVNAGAVQVKGGTPTVANTTLIQVYGQGGNDTIGLDEANGALPKANLFGGSGDDTLIGGSGADQIFGQAGNDTLLGKAGTDLLFGGADSDALTGGDGDDQAYGESGNDRLVWNPGDDSDLDEGGDGVDTVEVNGGNGSEIFTTTANGTRVRFDRLNPAPFFLDIGMAESLVLNANGGDDSFSATGNLAALIQLTVDGGTGNDTLLGGNGADTLLGGDGDDFVDGNQGNDSIFLGAGNDTFQWDPGDASDIVEGQADADSLFFNGANIGENIAIAANGERVRLNRDVGNVVLDLNDVETANLTVLGGADTIAIGDLSGTDLAAVNPNLAGTFGGTTGDGQIDQIKVVGTSGVDLVDITGSGTSAAVIGLPTLITVSNSEGAGDILVVETQAGDDTINPTTLVPGIVKLTVDSGTGNDMVRGSAGDDTLLGGDGDDFVDGNQGNDSIFLGAGNDTFQWDPGDASDIVEGQADADSLFFNGANIGENIAIAANGERVRLSRDVGNVVLDLNDVETANLTVLGGADTIAIGDLSGTDLAAVNLNLAAAAGGGDGQADNVIVNGTNGDDVIAVGGSPTSGVTVTGLAAAMSIMAPESSDILAINGLDGADRVDASMLEAMTITFAANGGLGSDTIFGSQGANVITGGDGNDVVFMGPGDDMFVWNPGDDNDTVEGQDGFDKLLFNGANIGENIDVSANGERVRFSRDVAGVITDLNDVETVTFNALGGADTISIGDLSGTDLIEANLNLAAAAGGGDGQVDNVIVNGTTGDDTSVVVGDANGTAVNGLAAMVNITGAEATNDRLTVNALAGDDVVDASGLMLGAIQLSANGGDGADVLIGGAGNDTLVGGEGDDVLLGGPGVDLLDGGGGDNVVIQD